MENVIRKLYGMYMDNDNGEKNEMSVMHDDLCKEKKEKAYQCYQKLKADAEAGDPEAIKRYESHLAKRRDEYHKKKARQEEVPA